MDKTRKSAKEKGDSLESAIQTLEAAILGESPYYADKTFEFEPKKVITVDGVRHEIDFWVNVDHGNGYKAVFIFECKNWKKKIGKSHIIEFSEKVRVAPAQKGFFVAKSFTRYAIAQAKKDPRIELLHVEELNVTEVPSFVQALLKSFHILRVIGVRFQVNFDFKCVRDSAPDMTQAPEFLIDGKAIVFDEYLSVWLNETIHATCLKFDSLNVSEGTHILPLENVRSFDNSNYLLNGEPLAWIKVSGIVQANVTRPSVIVSRVEIENRGRVYHAVSQSPYGRLETRIPQTMTLMRHDANDGREWKLENAVRLFYGCSVSVTLKGGHVKGDDPAGNSFP